jgi:hypothetical protein
MSGKQIGVLTALALLALPAAAQARPAQTAKDGRPNILVVMTDDQAQADVRHMPNVKRLLAARGTTFADALDSFPPCCPSRATFITGQYAHKHGVGAFDAAHTIGGFLLTTQLVLAFNKPCELNHDAVIQVL